MNAIICEMKAKKGVFSLHGLFYSAYLQRYHTQNKQREQASKHGSGTKKALAFVCSWAIMARVLQIGKNMTRTKRYHKQSRRDKALANTGQAVCMGSGYTVRPLFLPSALYRMCASGSGQPCSLPFRRFISQTTFANPPAKHDPARAMIVSNTSDGLPNPDRKNQPAFHV